MSDVISTYKIAVSSLTNTYFMMPYKPTFAVFTDPEKSTLVPLPGEEIIYIDTDIYDIDDLDTMLYNEGFVRGTIDGVQHICSKVNVKYLNLNKNNIMMAQYQLTSDPKFLREIDRRKLYSLCQIGDDNKVYYPTIRDKDGLKILTYTSPYNIPNDMFVKYSGFQVITIELLGKEARTFLVNNQFILKGEPKNGKH